MMAVMLEQMRARTTEMVAALERIVSVESPTADVAACTACAREVAALGGELLGREPAWIEHGGRPHLRWDARAPRPVLLLAHLDTVWPIGTLARRPFTLSDGIASGPGAFDMKAGVVMALFAIQAAAADGVELLVTSDEETGSASSRALIEDAARKARAVFVLEAAEDGALKIARKGVSMYTMTVRGRAAHAGLEPERGVNALIELAHQVHALEAIARPEAGTTVTPTVAQAGTTTNTVPAEARLHIDVRAPTPQEQTRVDTEVRALGAHLDGATVVVDGGPNRPPLPRAASAELFARAAAVARSLGLEPFAGVEVGGGSDGNFAAAVGTPTLDGLGAVGAGAHAEHEHVVVAAMPERAALLAGLITDVLERPLGRDDEAGRADPDAATRSRSAR